MVLTHNTKRKRKEIASTSLLLDESPKRTKVQAQRKFAQGSNVSSPVLTPVEELDRQTDRKDVLPEPVDLEPMKRPNTEDFLTFLCFRGTPALPPNLSFFNNPRNDRTSIGSSSNSSSNGSIATIPFSTITQSSHSRRSLPLQPPPSICSIMRPSPNNPGFSGTDGIGTGGRPFVAFGVRKRADPVLVSRHMDRKRRHALAVHALRRRYQEQRQAKLRALTVSKLSADKGGGNLGGGGWGGNNHRESKELPREIKETNKEVHSKIALSSEVPASSTATTIRAKRKAANIRVNLRPIISKVRTRGNCAPSHHKTSRRIIQRDQPPVRAPNIANEIQTTSSTKVVKQKMCLRSFRGRFVQRELAVVKLPQKQQRQRRIAASAVKQQKRQLPSQGKMKKATDLVVKKAPKKEEAVEEEESDKDSDDKPLKRRKPSRKPALASKSPNKTTVELRLTRSSRLSIKSNFTAISTTKRQTLQRRLITTNAKNILKTKLRQRAQVSKAARTSPDVAPRKMGLRGAANREIAKQKTLPRRVVRRIVLQSEVIPVKNKKLPQQSVKSTVDVKKSNNSKEAKEISENVTKATESANKDSSGNKKSLENVKKTGESTLKSKDISNKCNSVKETAHVKSITTRNEASKAIKSNEKVPDRNSKVVMNEISLAITRNAEKTDKDKVNLKFDTKMSKVEKVVQQLKESVIEKSEMLKGTTLKEKSKVKENSEIILKKKTEVVEKPASKLNTKDKCNDLALKPEEIIDSSLNLKHKAESKSECHVAIGTQDTNLKLGDKEKPLSFTDKGESKEKSNVAKVNLRKQIQPLSMKLQAESTKERMLGAKAIELSKVNISETVKRKVDVVQRIGTEIGKEIIELKRFVPKENELSKERISETVKRKVDSIQRGGIEIGKEIIEMKRSVPKENELLKEGISETVKRKVDGVQRTGTEIGKEIIEMQRFVPKERISETVKRKVDGVQRTGTEIGKEIIEMQRFVPKERISETVKRKVDGVQRTGTEIGKEIIEMQRFAPNERISETVKRKVDDVQITGTEIGKERIEEMQRFIPKERISETVKRKVDGVQRIGAEIGKEIIEMQRFVPKERITETVKRKMDTVQRTGTEIGKEILEMKRFVPEKPDSVKETNNGDSLKDAMKEKQCLLKGTVETIKQSIKNVDQAQASVKEISKILTNKKLPRVTSEIKQNSLQIPKLAQNILAANENTTKIQLLNKADVQGKVLLKVADSMLVKVEQLSAVNKTTLSPKHEVDVKKIVKSEKNSSVDEIIKEVLANDSKLKAKIDFLESKLNRSTDSKDKPDLILETKELKTEEIIPEVQKTVLNYETTSLIRNIATESTSENDKSTTKNVAKGISIETVICNSLVNNKDKKIDEETEKNFETTKNPAGKSISTSVNSTNTISGKGEVVNNKSHKEELLTKRIITKRRLVKEKHPDHNVVQRPTRKTKEAAALYMEILNHKLENDDDNGSIDSFPELPCVKKMFQREHELKTAQATKTKPDKVDDKNSSAKINDSDSSDDCLIKYKIMKTNEKTPSKLAKASAKAQVNIEKRAMRNKSPKLYKSFTDTEESDADNKIEVKPKQTTGKRKSNSITLKKQPIKDANNAPVVDFSESDEEPLANLMSTKELSSAVTLEVTADVPSPTYGKPKRECTKRPQNYLTIFSSSDDEERYFHTKKPEISITPVPKETVPVEVLTSKDIGRRFGKGKVNMSTEQIEKWLNDSALAGMSVRKENDEMLKFGEKIPALTESSNVVQTPVTLAESLKSDMITITGLIKDKPDTPVKSSQANTTSNNKPSSAERKCIFRKKLESLTPETSPQKVNAFSVQNERSVYAFEPEPEVCVSTPFRRPARRPSSTATSKSEDESKLVVSDDVTLAQTTTIKSQFRHPSENVTTAKSKMQPPKVTNTKSVTDKGLSKADKSGPSKANANKTSQKNSADRLSETSEDWKYKVPSSPSAASSSSSAKLYKKSNTGGVTSTVLKVSHAEFPSINAEKAAMVDAPVFYPTEKEFQDPLEYIEKIRSHAERYGICKIAPPANFRPECKIADEMRFTAYNQYVGKMLRRWGPSFKELMAIRRYMRTQGISLKPAPLIGGIEVDLPRLYQTVQTLGGLKEVIEKKKWPKVSEMMKIPKSAQDRVTKLDDIYCKYLLPYDTLSPVEREKLFDEVETNWAKRESKSLLKAQKAIMDDSDDADGEDESDEDDEEDWEQDEAEECIVKGKNMALNAFFRIARNTLAMWFKSTEPSTTDVEDDFWRLVRQRQQHVCVHSGSIDCGGTGGPSGAMGGGGGGYGFATSKSATCARHPANLKVLTNSSGSVLRSMGPIMGLTVPTLHVGMVFSACCWYRDPHRLPWIEYLHTGASKVWYAVPGAQSTRFQAAVNTHMMQYCRNKSLWLPVDTAMLPPELLTKSGCSLSRVVQEPGQFVVVFEEAFTSNICTGYVVSESVFWAPSRWLSQSAQAVFHELRANREPSVFSYERLVLSIASDQRANVQTLKEVVEPVQAIHDRERAERGRLVNALGVKEDKDKLPLPDVRGRRRRGGRGGGKQGGGPGGQAAPPPPQHWAEEEEGEYECYVCRANLYVSMVADTRESVVFCLSHAIRRIEQSRLLAVNCRLLYTYTVPELDALCSRLQALIDLKLQRKQPYKTSILGASSGGGKFSGLPTLLNR